MFDSIEKWLFPEPDPPRSTVPASGEQQQSQDEEAARSTIPVSPTPAASIANPSPTSNVEDLGEKIETISGHYSDRDPQGDGATEERNDGHHITGLSSESLEDDEILHSQSSTTLLADALVTALAGYQENEVESSPSAGENDELSNCEYKDGVWTCLPYQKEILDKQIERTKPGPKRRRAILAALRKLGIKVYVIGGATRKETTRNIMEKVHIITREVARENSVEPWTGSLGYLRCILYQDPSGRLFNLTFPAHSVGPLGKWQEYLDSFSCTQAVVALMVLWRSFPCASEVTQLQPGYLSLILGLVFTEEIGLSGLNAVMLVQGMPSVSAYFMTTPFGPDVLRKVIIFTLALSSVLSGDAQRITTVIGIACACMALLANVGSRAWHFLRWQPMRYSGPGSNLVAYVLAVLTGACLPFLGQRSVSVGGKGAIESVVLSAFMVAICFTLSDYDHVQKFLVVGSEDCNQDIVNVIGSVWWTITLLCSLNLVQKIPYHDVTPEYGERVLVEDHTSPVGYKIANLPDFEIDPNMAKEGISWFSIQLEIAFGIFCAAAIGFVMIAFTVSDWDNVVFSEIDVAIGALKNDLS